jgi:hypothetical protein
MAAKKTGAPIPATVPLRKLPLALGALVVGADAVVVGDVGVGVEGVVDGRVLWFEMRLWSLVMMRRR